MYCRDPRLPQHADMLLFLPPPTSHLCSQDDLFEFPFLDICFWKGQGCDASLNESWCIDTAIFTVYDPCRIETDGVGVRSQVSALLVRFGCL